MVNEDRPLMSSSICPPAVRMVVLHAGTGSEDEPDSLTPYCNILPVVAVQSIVTRDGPDFDESYIQGDLLVYEPDDFRNVSSYTQMRLDWFADAFKVIVCTWSPDEDGERLKEAIEQLQKKAVAKAIAYNRGLRAGLSESELRSAVVDAGTREERPDLRIASNSEG